MTLSMLGLRKSAQEKHHTSCWPKWNDVYVYRETNAPIITYSECVFIALGNQHAMRMRHFVTCGLLSYTMFSTLSQTVRFSRRVTEHVADATD
jgi:hypothetical protein